MYRGIWLKRRPIQRTIVGNIKMMAIARNIITTPTQGTAKGDEKFFLRQKTPRNAKT